VAIRVSRFAGEFAQLAEWTGESERELRDDKDYHSPSREHWLAWDGDQLVGALHPWRSPDGRHRLYFDRCRADSYGALAAVVAGECYTHADITDAQVLAELSAAGFAEVRREHEYLVPVAQVHAPVPGGLRLVTADKTELEPLMMLDCAIRADIPGSEGWEPDPVWFREETYDSPFFDPQTYLVAIDGDDYIGLVRIWRALPGRELQRLGCVGVLAGYRRRGLARALIAAAFMPLVRRAVTHVNAEVDASNDASNALFAGLGAAVVGSTIELRRS